MTVEDSTSVTTSSTRVAVTGATGFVGRWLVRELVARGLRPVCLVRDTRRLERLFGGEARGRMEVVAGDLFDETAVGQTVRGAQAAVHLVGIIAERPRLGQTFERIHVEGTRKVVRACEAAGVRRLVHVSALGARPGAVSTYHRTKWAAECAVRDSGLDWTIFRPSVIHGRDGEFMRLMRMLACGGTVPAFGFVPMPLPLMPHIGNGLARLQPVAVQDVAFCCVAALNKAETIGQTYELGGPRAMSWKELYRICQEVIPGAKRWKPILGQPVWAARLAAATVMRLPILPRAMRFNLDQIVMSQEDSVCDVRPVEETFGIKLREFRSELAAYAAEIPVGLA